LIYIKLIVRNKDKGRREHQIYRGFSNRPHYWVHPLVVEENSLLQASIKMLKMFTRANYKGFLNLWIKPVVNLLRYVITPKASILKPPWNWIIPSSLHLKFASNPSCWDFKMGFSKF